MAVYASYADAHDTKYGEPLGVPLIIANEDNLKGYGRKVIDFDNEEVWIVPWPQTGTRPICPGYGVGGGIVQGAFLYQWKGDELWAENQAVREIPVGYVTGRLPKDVPSEKRTHILVREANCHPDGGQVFYPENGDAFVMVLALPGDDVKPEDFRAFYFDGSFGLQIHPGVWHQPLYPIADKARFIGKQGAIFALKTVDTVNEFGKWLKVPLKPEFAK